MAATDSLPTRGRRRSELRSRGHLRRSVTALGSAFRHLFRAVSRMRGRDTHLGGAELSHAQFELLIELDERGELPAGELAAAARLTPATVTQMLDAPRRPAGTSSARARTTDRRVVVSRLTAQGRAQDRGQARGLARALGARRWRTSTPRELRAATRVLRAARRDVRGGAAGGRLRGAPEGRCKAPIAGARRNAG